MLPYRLPILENTCARDHSLLESGLSVASGNYVPLREGGYQWH
jgi:hypothetical protein